jgi:hypothetical protein
LWKESGRLGVDADHPDRSLQRAPYLRYPLAYEHVAELLAERGIDVDPSCIWRWVQVYAPELNKRCRRYLKPVNKSYRIDETYIKVKGEDKYLYRALDSTGQTINFLLMAKRDRAAAKRFLRRANRLGVALCLPEAEGSRLLLRTLDVCSATEPRAEALLDGEPSQFARTEPV